MVITVDTDLDEAILLVGDQLRLGPAERLASLLGPERWPGCLEALHAAASVSGAVVIGPVAVALHGGPQQPEKGRVDLLCAPADEDDVVYALIDVGARPTQQWRSSARPGAELLQELSIGAGLLSLRTRPAGALDPAAIVAGAELVDVAGVTVRVAALEDLAALTFASPWAEDGPFRTGIRALRAHHATRAAA